MYFIGRASIGEQLNSIESTMLFNSIEEFETFLETSGVTEGVVVIDTFGDVEYLDTLYFILHHRNTYSFQFIVLVDNLNNQNVNKFYEFGIYAIATYDPLDIEKIKEYIHRYPKSLHDTDEESDVLADILDEIILPNNQEPASKEPLYSEKQDKQGPFYNNIVEPNCKIIGFTGIADVGVTTAVLLTAESLSEWYSVAILDLTFNRDLYEKYSLKNNSAGLAESLYKLAEFNSKNPFKITDRIDLYTAPYTMNINLPRLSELVSRIENDYNIVLVDMDFEINKQLLSSLHELFIVSDIEPTNVKYVREYLSRILEFFDVSKVRIVLNKYIPNVFSDDKFVISLVGRLDFSPPYFKLDFSKDILSGSITNSLELQKLTEQIQNQVRTISNFLRR